MTGLDCKGVNNMIGLDCQGVNNMIGLDCQPGFLLVVQFVPGRLWLLLLLCCSFLLELLQQCRDVRVQEGMR